MTNESGKKMTVTTSEDENRLAFVLLKYINPVASLLLQRRQTMNQLTDILPHVYQLVHAVLTEMKLELVLLIP